MIGTIENVFHDFESESNIRPKNLNPFENYKSSAFKVLEKSGIKEFNEMYFNSKHNPVPIAIQDDFDYSVFKVNAFKEAHEDDPFLFVTGGKRFSQFNHKNPQYYEYKLGENSLYDIALKHMDADNGVENDLTRATNEFMTKYYGKESRVKISEPTIGDAVAQPKS